MGQVFTGVGLLVEYLFCDSVLLAQSIIKRQYCAVDYYESCILIGSATHCPRPRVLKVSIFKFKTMTGNRHVLLLFLKNNILSDKLVHTKTI